MSKYDLQRLLAQNPYPGRGILLGVSADGRHAVVAYFIMGRSGNSRNRVFIEKNGGIITEAADPAKMEDPSLVIYAPVRTLGPNTIVTNGDQTDTVYSCLERGIGFQEALRARTFEPDAPNFTPRISGLVSVTSKKISYCLSILKSAGGNPDSVQRMFFEYMQPLAGEGHFIHTYEGNGNPLPSFEGEPRTVALSSGIDALGRMMWEALDPENKVSLFVRYIEMNGGVENRIYNKYKQI